MVYAENLPPQCPPNDADDVELAEVYRLVASNPPTAQCFKSHAALDKPNPTKINACAFASCSLVIDPVAQIKRYPRLREDCKFAAKMTIPVNTGRSKAKKNSNHIHFWLYAGKNMGDYVLEIIDLPEVDPDA